MHQVGSEVEVRHYLDVWKAGRADNEWIPELAAEGNWVVITGDRGKGPAPRLPAVCAQCGVTHVLLAPSVHQMSSEKKLRAIVYVWDELVEISERGEPGRRFKLYAPEGKSPYLRQFEV